MSAVRSLFKSKTATLALASALGACATSPWRPTPSPEVAGLRVLVPQQAEVTWTDPDCEAFATNGLKQRIASKLQTALSHVGFSVTTDSNRPVDSVVQIKLSLGSCSAFPPGMEGMVTIAMEPGVVISQKYYNSSRQNDEELDWEWNSVDTLQSAPQVRALRANKASPAAETPPARSPAAPEPATARAAAVPADDSGRDFVQGGQQQDTVAIVVGIEHYRDVPAATGAVSDARTFALLATRSLGVPEANVHVLLDDHATRSDIDKRLAWLSSNVPEGGRVVFYFGGHGAPDPSTGIPYVVPYDGDPKSLNTTAIQLSDLLKALNGTKAKEIVAFVDSCFSGAGGRSVLPAGTRPLVLAKSPIAEERVAVFSAASGEQIAGPAAGGGGLFTKVLVDAIKSGAADIDGDGRISLHELREWVIPRVAREARKDGRDQTPSLITGERTSEERFLLVTGLPQQ